MTTTTTTRDCDRCYGKGRLPHYMHVADGVCFACRGSGRLRGRILPTTTRQAKPVEILTSDRYPGWSIIRQGGASFNMTKNGQHIMVTQTNGKDWTGYVMAQDMTGVFTGTVAECVEFCGG